MGGAVLRHALRMRRRRSNCPDLTRLGDPPYKPTISQGSAAPAHCVVVVGVTIWQGEPQEEEEAFLRDADSSSVRAQIQHHRVEESVRIESSSTVV
ncbi:Hypothetical protein SMAX5B_007457 [Scophthalmus maximus]|uniref:Uncharacterized protein n=1 Tax=Scophthalmus maximus TaxID=52904 RepID=A0A2U9BPF7_SCOMX|nr:Hypothetical protein SMAX5B_007457 [Scophthalmus maximus]